MFVIHIPVLESGGRAHAFAGHFLCLAHLPEQFPLLSQKLLIFLHHGMDPLFLLKATREEDRYKTSVLPDATISL